MPASRNGDNDDGYSPLLYLALGLSWLSGRSRLPHAAEP